MTEHENQWLSGSQLAAIEAAFSRGSAAASEALTAWIGKPTVVRQDSLMQLPLEAATEVLAMGDAPVCFCAAAIKGPLTGEMILAFDETSGLALADLLLDQRTGTTMEWSELAISAALETTNILSCAFLNALVCWMSPDSEHVELLPTPPRFSCDFAQSLLEFALMGQAVASDQVLLTRTRFEVAGTPAYWTLLLVPDGATMSRLGALLSDPTSTTEDG